MFRLHWHSRDCSTANSWCSSCRCIWYNSKIVTPFVINECYHTGVCFIRIAAVNIIWFNDTSLRNPINEYIYWFTLYAFICLVTPLSHLAVRTLHFAALIWIGKLCQTRLVSKSTVSMYVLRSSQLSDITTPADLYK